MQPLSESRPRTVLAIASQGGHWVQLRRMRAAWTGCRTTYVCTNPGYRREVVEAEPDAGFMTVPDANVTTKLRLILQALHVALIVLRLRPDAIITTGAAPGYFAVRIGRLIGARTVWIDSIANGQEMSLSGRKAGPYAGLWLTQWQHLAVPDAKSGRGPRFRGAII
ncbi:MAG: UDP-N-acetylglucosamine--LPS N-acetylglucosamine transferase [Pseudomonadota bacterium]